MTIHFAESAFGTLKRAPEYPTAFLDVAEAGAYFKGYFTWYNMEHYHSGIDYVTPEQAHQGLRDQIVNHRKIKQLTQRSRRLEENQKRKSGQNNKNHKPTITAQLVA